MPDVLLVTIELNKGVTTWSYCIMSCKLELFTSCGKKNRDWRKCELVTDINTLKKSC